MNESRAINLIPKQKELFNITYPGSCVVHKLTWIANIDVRIHIRGKGNAKDTFPDNIRFWPDTKTPSEII